MWRMLSLDTSHTPPAITKSRQNGNLNITEIDMIIKLRTFHDQSLEMWYLSALAQWTPMLYPVGGQINNHVKPLEAIDALALIIQSSLGSTSLPTGKVHHWAIILLEKRRSNVGLFKKTKKMTGYLCNWSPKINIRSPLPTRYQVL